MWKQFNGVAVEAVTILIYTCVGVHRHQNVSYSDVQSSLNGIMLSTSLLAISYECVPNEMTHDIKTTTIQVNSSVEMLTKVSSYMVTVIGLSIVAVHFSIFMSVVIIDVQPRIISPGITPSLVVNCSVTDNQQSEIKIITSLSLSRYNESSKAFDVLYTLDAKTLLPQQVALLTDTEISSGNIFLAMTIYNPTKSDAQVYRCNVFGDSYQGNNISIADKKKVEEKTIVSELLEEILRLKKLDTSSQECSAINTELIIYNENIKLEVEPQNPVEFLKPLNLTCSLRGFNATMKDYQLDGWEVSQLIIKK
ncbi:fibrinogen related protein 12.1-as2 precursor, partial [Biomphalaria pfeifferi]